jgi:lambda family phage portal protein
VLLESGEPDDAVNDLLYERWNAWAHDPAAVSADGRLDFRGVQEQMVIARKQDGEAFLELLPGFPNPWRFAVQFWDADQLDHEYNIPAGSGQNEIRMGIEVTAWNRPVAYWMWRRHPTDYGTVQGNKRIRIPAERMIHWFEPLRAGRTRGVPEAAAILMEARMYQGYREAELVAARTSAAKMGFIQRPVDDLAGAGVDEQLPETMDADAGVFTRLGIGETFAPWDPQHPVTAFNDFCKGILRNIASGLGLSYISLSGDLADTSYSSGRVGLLQEQDEWKTQQQRLIAVLCRRLWPVWFAQARLTGQLDVIEDVPTEAIQWQARSFPWIDPRTEVEATVTELTEGLTSRTRVCAQKGVDFFEVLDELAKEQAEAERLGVELGEAKPEPPPGFGGDEDDENESNVPARGLLRVARSAP